MHKEQHLGCGGGKEARWRGLVGLKKKISIFFYLFPGINIHFEDTWCCWDQSRDLQRRKEEIKRAKVNLERIIHLLLQSQLRKERTSSLQETNSEKSRKPSSFINVQSPTDETLL